MYQCEVCEDWFHDDCVAKGSNGEIPPEDAFNDFICISCVRNLKFFSKLHLIDNPFFYFSRQHEITCAPFLLAGWRESLRTAAVGWGWPAVSQRIGHLLRDEEPVYEPPIDTEATESLYDRKWSLLSIWLWFSTNILYISISLVGLKALEQSAPRDQAILGIKNDRQFKGSSQGLFGKYHFARETIHFCWGYSHILWRGEIEKETC